MANRHRKSESNTKGVKVCSKCENRGTRTEYMPPYFRTKAEGSEPVGFVPSVLCLI